MTISAPHQYLTIAQVDELLTFLLPNTVYSDWTETFPTALKTRSTYLTTAIFDTLHWKGKKVYDWQNHAFPRWFTGDEQKPYDSDLTFSADVGDLPYAIAMAFAITACYVAYNETNNITDADEILSLGFSRISIGSLSVDLNEAGSNEDVALLPDEAIKWLKPFCYISKSGKGISEFKFV